jgi:hypothetical protein
MKTNRIFLSALAIGAGIFAFNACSSSDDDNSLPPIGGFNNAGEVGADNLVAYWPLDGNGTESKSGTAPSSSSGVAWTDSGVKGQAANMTNGFMKYPSIAALTTGMTSFSVSGWFKVSNNSDTTGSSSVFFSLARPGEWAGNINYMAETGWQPSTSDTLTVKGYLFSDNALGGQDTRNATTLTPDDILAGGVANPNKIAGHDVWSQGVITWDNATRLFKVYVNGSKISNPQWELRGDDSSPAFATTAGAFPVLGAFGTFADGTTTDTWNRGLTGQLDEVRVWNRALTLAEIGSLYQLELNGR